MVSLIATSPLHHLLLTNTATTRFENVHPDSTMKATTTVTPRQVDIYSFQMFYLLPATTSQVRCHCHHYRDHWPREIFHNSCATIPHHVTTTHYTNHHELTGNNDRVVGWWNLKGIYVPFFLGFNRDAWRVTWQSWVLHPTSHITNGYRSRVPAFPFHLWF